MGIKHGLSIEDQIRFGPCPTKNAYLTWCILWESHGDMPDIGDFMRIWVRARYGIPDVRFMDDDQLCYFYSSDTRSLVFSGGVKSVD